MKALVPPIRAAVLTSSDRCAAGQATDESGPAIAAFLRDGLSANVITAECVPDDGDLLENMFRTWSEPSAGIDLIVSSGGTGLSPRDVTPEAAMRVIDRPHPGIMELARARTGALHSRAYLSRGVAGAANGTLIVTLPGSPRGAIEQLRAIAELLPHAVELLRGAEGPHAPP